MTFFGADSWVRKVWVSRARSVADDLLGAYAALVFSSDRRVGLWVLLATFVDSSRGAHGVVAAALARWCLLRMSHPRDRLALGACTCSSLLLGLWSAEGLSAASLGTSAFFGVAAAVLAVFLRRLLAQGGVPMLALPFAMVATLLGAPGALNAGGAHPISDLSRVLSVAGAVVMDPRPGSGLLVIGALLLGSPWSLLMAVLGGAFGVWGASMAAASGGLLAALNGALCLMGLGGALCLPRLPMIAFGLMGSFVAGALTGHLAQVFPLTLGLPLIWPFLGISAVSLGALGALRPTWFVCAPLPGRAPEEQNAYFTALRTRLGLPGVPQFVLPVSGRWRITQGVDGGITHRGPLAFALDFEMTDAEGFPFQRDGQVVTDYFAYGQQVLSPGYGVVAAIHDGLPDCPPGAQNLDQPWGNCIVIAHGPECYSVLAHLLRGSMTVRVGDRVEPFQPLAACGSSGRSPRPHLHMQVQASPSLGAATLPFALLEYSESQIGEALRLVRRGIPREWSYVTALLPRIASASEVFLGLVLRDATGRVHPVSLREGPESYLFDEMTEEKLYFVLGKASVVFTCLEGSPSSPLGLLCRVLPVFPLGDWVEADVVETIPSAWATTSACRAYLRTLLNETAQVVMTVRRRAGGWAVMTEIRSTANHGRILALGEALFDAGRLVELSFEETGRAGAENFVECRPAAA